MTRLLIVIFLGFIVLKAESQRLPGPTFSAGLGIAHSKHASSYKEADIYRVKDFSGFRAIATDLKVGWIFHRQLGFALYNRWQPSNTTISPYNMNHAGGMIEFKPDRNSRTWFNLGMGKQVSRGNGRERLGEGTQVTLGMLNNLAPHIELHTDISFGKMENVDRDSGLELSGNEVMLQITVNYSITRF